MIYFISGTPASGKSSVAKALMQRFNQGVHIQVDDLRQMVVSGMAHPVPIWTDETTKQFALARKNAVQMALGYAQAGFTVAIDDVFSSKDFATDYAPYLENMASRQVLLLPSLEITLHRNSSRTNKDFLPETLEQVIRYLHHEFSNMNQENWTVIDSSHLSLKQTVENIYD